MVAVPRPLTHNDTSSKAKGEVRNDAAPLGGLIKVGISFRPFQARGGPSTIVAT